MHCIVIGVSHISSKNDEDVPMAKVAQQVVQVKGSTLIWLANSVTRDEDGTPTRLVSCVTESSVEDVTAAVSEVLPEQYTSELWGSAPAILPLKPPGGYHHHLFYDNATVFEEWASDTMKEYGMFVQQDLLSTEEVVELKHAVLDEIEHAESLLVEHRPSINIGKDSMSFKEIASRGNERFDLLIPPTSAAGQFVSDVIHARISFVLDKIIGQIDTEVDCDISVVYSKPGAPNQGWHADGDHQKGASDAGLDAEGWKTSLSDPYALCLFIPLIALDEDTGYTQFWPASHRNKGLAGFGPFAEIAEATWDGKCNAGSAIWYDYRLMHRGMRNNSTLLRPVLQLLFKRKWYVEKRNYGNESIVPSADTIG